MSGYFDRRPHILHVDDSQLIRTVIRRVIEKLGYPLRQASGAEEAFELLSPDISLLLTDYEMPGMDGIEMVRHIRERQEYADLPVIVISGSVTPALTDRGRDAGIDRFLNKPVKADTLGAAIRQVFRPVLRELSIATKD